MKYIMIAMNSSQSSIPQNMSLLHKILKETQNPKIAAVLALDLMLVGVDTVSVTECDILILAVQIFFSLFSRHLLQYRRLCIN